MYNDVYSINIYIYITGCGGLFVCWDPPHLETIYKMAGSIYKLLGAIYKLLEAIYKLLDAIYKLLDAI